MRSNAVGVYYAAQPPVVRIKSINWRFMDLRILVDRVEFADDVAEIDEFSG